MSTIKIKAPSMPEPEVIDRHLPTGITIRGYTKKQLAARDAQWQEKYELLLDELRDAATSLETISRSAGKRWVLDDAGNHVENYLQHPDQIRGYAASRAAVARSALSAITEE